jgi:hypothetical protein
MEGQQHGDRLKRGLKTAIFSLLLWAALSAPACFWAVHPLFSPPAPGLFWAMRSPVLSPS